MKPWKPYLNGLNQIMDRLLHDAGPRPFAKMDRATGWIQSLKFVDMSLCDNECRWISEELIAHGDCSNYHSIFNSDSIRWQAILRCGMALDFCRGRVGKRRQFDWSQKPEAIYKWLLVDYWRRDALYWANRKYGSFEPISEKILGRLSKNNPANN
jgi:hypothetical protein